MSQSEVAQILSALEELKKRMQVLEGRLDVVAHWQSDEDRRKREAQIRREAYARPVRMFVAVVTSRTVQGLGPWVFAAAGVGWATLRG